MPLPKEKLCPAHGREICEDCGVNELEAKVKAKEEKIQLLEARNLELLETLKAVEDAGRGLFLTLDPRAGVGERMSIVWDRLVHTIYRKL